MKNALFTIALAGILILVVTNLDIVTDFTVDIISDEPKVTVDEPGKYAYDNNYLYIQKTDDYTPYSKQDIMNILYSIFDNGYNTFTFYCPSEYSDCIKDVEEITNNRTVITDIGNYVHPFNNYTTLKVVTDPLGEVNIIVTKTYTNEMIDIVNEKLDEIFETVTTDDMDVEDKMLKIHDYVAEHTFYDQHDESKNSGNAYGALVDGKAKCAGYADVMALVLDRLDIKNYKVASETHVWNAVYLNGEWSQIDLTWDDPVVEEGTNLSDSEKDMIRHKFYMIDTNTLLSYDTKEHGFDKNVYLEVRE